MHLKTFTLAQIANDVIARYGVTASLKTNRPALAPINQNGLTLQCISKIMVTN